MYYFAYGSNMSEKRLTRRIPARRLGVAVLSGYVLAFTKPSEADGSAKCDVCPTGNENSLVYGVLYEIDPEHKPVLDRYEGLGYGYTSETLEVTHQGRKLRALAYVAVNRDETLKPFHWYKEHVVQGALENDLPQEYVRNIRDVTSVPDPDANRSAMELEIYRSL